MRQVIDDRNEEWFEFVKHMIEQGVLPNTAIDDKIIEALQQEPEERSHPTPPHD